VGSSNWVIRALRFLRLVDNHDGALSLTSIALLASLVALILTQSFAILGAFIACIILYAHKRKVSDTYRDHQILSANQATLLAELEKEVKAHAPQLEERIKRVEDGLVMIRNRIGAK
jgi:hypothetical protein